MFQPLPGTVCTQLASWPAGAIGPNQTSTDRSPLTAMPFFRLLMLGNGTSVWSSERVWLSYRTNDQKFLAGMPGGRWIL